MARPFRRSRGAVEMRLEDAEVQLVRQLTTDLVARLSEVHDNEPVSDRALGRLFPDGYADDPKAAAELRSLIQDDLRDSKIAAGRTVLETLAELPPNGRLSLDPDRAHAWLGALNDLRLTLGTALDVTEDTELDFTGADESAGFALSVYVFLGWLQQSLVEALAG